MKRNLRTRALVLVSMILTNVGSPSNAVASAGYYPTTPGDLLNISFCMNPKAGPYLYILGTKDLKVYKTFKKFKPVFVGNDTFCDVGEFLYEYDWRVNTKGSWTLFFYSPTLKKRYWGWPDGIESR